MKLLIFKVIKGVPTLKKELCTLFRGTWTSLKKNLIYGITNTYLNSMLGQIKLKQLIFVLWYVSWNYDIFHTSGVNCYIKKIYLKDKSIFFSGSKIWLKRTLFGRKYISVKKSKIWPFRRSTFVENIQDTTFISFLITTRSDVFWYSAWKWQWVMGLTLAVTDTGNHPCSCHQHVKTETKEKTT